MSELSLGKATLELAADGSSLEATLAGVERSTGQRVSALGGSLTKTLTPIAGSIGALGAAAFSDWDAGIDAIRAQTGATGDELKQFEGVLKNVAGSSTQSFSTIGQTVAELNQRLGLTGSGAARVSERAAGVFPAVSRAPRAPAGLGKAGRALWTRVLADVAPEWELDARDLVLLEQAARAADRLAELEAQVGADGLMLAGSKDQPVLHPAVAEARQTRELVARLLGRVELAPPAPRTGHLSARQRDQLQEARRARWTGGRAHG